MSMKQVIKSANGGDGSHSKPAHRPDMSGRGLPNGGVGSMSTVKKIAGTGKR